jgi:hypothetical protein
MNIAWSYTAVGLLTVAAAAIVTIGEPANAELRIAEAAKSAATAGAETLCALGPRTEPAAAVD